MNQFKLSVSSTHELPKFQYWCWQTMTGFTGVVLTLIWITMYVFALSYVRSKIYNWFWYTHSLYPLFFIFMILHGTGRLIQVIQNNITAFQKFIIIVMMLNINIFAGAFLLLFFPRTSYSFHYRFPN